MDSGVTAAIVTSGVSIIIAGGTAWWARTVQHDAITASRELELLRSELQKQSEDDKRRFERERMLARYRDPLFSAASELDDRLRNIQEDEFLLYIKGPRRESALHSTVYRFARYFGILEIIRNDLTFLRLSSAEDTERLSRLLSEIGRSFATDKFDRDAGFETSKFMVWREDQRAMGELAIEITPEGGRLVGYATFVNRFSEGGDAWFRGLLHDLIEEDPSRSDRLRHIRQLLGDLVKLLGPDGSG